MADLVIEETRGPAMDTVQATNERYEGEAGLYDIMVLKSLSERSTRLTGSQYIARVNVTNIGKVGGAEVAQLVSSDHS